jgi:alkylated DNA repair protein (DNA oxidative demethylase)
MMPAERNPPSLSLFDQPEPAIERLGPGTILLRQFALPVEAAILRALEVIAEVAPFRHMVTPGGHTMSVAMTSTGMLGWVSDPRGYRYDRQDPGSGKPWPPMPDVFSDLARRAAREGGYPDFRPDSCLINRYEPGAKMSLHQDRDERDFVHPIVSVSLGLPATFQLGGLSRKDPVVRVPLRHGDVLVWGGTDRLRFHGVLPVKPGRHEQLGPVRINLTFRRAG